MASKRISRRSSVWLLIAILLWPFVGFSQMSDPNHYVKAEIYYYGWDVLTRSRLSLDTVRKEYATRIEIKDAAEVSGFVRWLRLDELETLGNAQPEDPRLVIDLFTSEGSISTYYASRFAFLSSDSRKKRQIDDAFRNRFVFGK